MKIEDFPILLAGYEDTVAKFKEQHAAQATRNPRLARSFNEEYYKNRLNNVLEIFIAADEAGEIANARYIEAKDTLNRVVEEVYNTLVTSPYLSMNDRSNDGPLHDLYWAGKPSLHTMEGFLKKLGKIFKQAPNEPLVRTAVAYTTELLPLAKLVKELKSKTTKRVAKSEEEKRAEKFTPPPSSSKAVAQVRAMLEEFVKENYENLLEYIEAGMVSDLEAYLKACDEVAAGTYDRKGRRAFNQNVRSFSPYHFFRFADGSIDSSAAANVDTAVEMGQRADGQLGYVRRANATTILHARAERDAKEIREVYVVKNLKKLTSIIEAKGDDNFASVEKYAYSHTNLSYLEGGMVVKFKDGSQFTAKNSVTFVINSFNTRFLRFPLTFHNVIMPNGEPMGRPSEKRMNTVFIAGV